MGGVHARDDDGRERDRGCAIEMRTCDAAKVPKHLGAEGPVLPADR